MNPTKILISAVFCSLLFIQCKSPESENELIAEPVGGSYYYIKNQTDLDLLAQFPVPVYDRSIDSIVFVDSTILVNRLSTTKILEDMGNFGFNPTPAHTFKGIKFYKAEDVRKTVILEMKPVKTDKWISNIIDRDSYGYGLTEYQLVLNKEDF